MQESISVCKNGVMLVVGNIRLRMKINQHNNLENAWANSRPWQEMTEEAPLLSPEWLLTWWKHFGEQSELVVLEAIDPNGKTVGIAPFQSLKTIGCCQLRTLGSGSVCTDYMRLISQKDFEATLINLFSEYLSSHFEEQSSLQSHELVFEGIEANASWVESFCNTMHSLGFHCWQSSLEGSFLVELPKTWKEYVSSLGHSAKRKARKVISRFESGQVRFVSTDVPEEIFSKLPELERIHQERRVSMGQPGSYADDRFGPFLREAVSLLAQRGKIRMEWCESEGETIAIHLVLVGKHGTFMYQSGIDPRFIELEPGHALTVAAIRRAIENGDRFYDLLRGQEAYKSYWGGQMVPLSTLRCRPPQALSRIAGITHQGLWQMKQSIKSAAKAAKCISFANWPTPGAKANA